MTKKVKHKLRAPQYKGYYLLIRTYEDTPFVGVYIIGRNGSLRSGLLNGTLMADEADRLAEHLGLKVKREKNPYRLSKSQRIVNQTFTNQGLFSEKKSTKMLPPLDDEHGDWSSK